ncbi:unnamed protein product [Urochloa decumbens]|uniref:F-box domain-containing protein n=1 Tax=Urochloa decumbens TaxID=240449 RepID=A0ABC9FL32_9POAL
MAARLPDELVDLILLRLPPSDPGSLVRAALVCRTWRRLLSAPAFRRRFLDFRRRSPPMLGFLYRAAPGHGARFMPTPSFRPPFAGGRPAAWRAVDARHGRVLYFDGESVPFEPVLVDLVVSHPFTGEERRITTPRNFFRHCSWSGALLCAALGCGHLDCPPAGPFAVVFVGTDEGEERTRAYHYSSESGKWSNAAFIDHPTDRVTEGRSVLVENAVYFIWEESNGILQYDLGKQELSMISLPPVCKDWFVAVMTAEDGGLGFAIVKDFKLHMWSREQGPDGSGWAQRRVVELKSVAPDCSLSTLPSNVVPFASGDSVIFAFTRDVGVFAIDVKSGRITKVCKVGAVYGVVPYICFYVPALKAANGVLRQRKIDHFFQKK